MNHVLGLIVLEAPAGQSPASRKRSSEEVRPAEELARATLQACLVAPEDNVTEAAPQAGAAVARDAAPAGERAHSVGSSPASPDSGPSQAVAEAGTDAAQAGEKACGVGPWPALPDIADFMCEHACQQTSEQGLVLRANIYHSLQLNVQETIDMAAAFQAAHHPPEHQGISKAAKRAKAQTPKKESKADQGTPDKTRQAAESKREHSRAYHAALAKALIGGAEKQAARLEARAAGRQAVHGR